MSLQRRLRILNGGTEDFWMESALKVAFASTDMNTVNQHFGSARSFAIYGVDRDNSGLLEVTQFGYSVQDGNEDKLTARLQALEGCIAVYSQAVGTSAVGQLKARGIQPVKVLPDTPVADLLASLQNELRTSPGVWLARAIASRQPPDSGRFDVMEDESWRKQA